MWKLYDELCTGIPSGIVIEECRIGEKWTTVRANGCVGVARNLEAPCLHGDEFKGAYLRDTACHLRWNSLTRAAVGMAAINAFHNTRARVEGLDAACEKAEAPYAALGGKKLAVVGECPLFDAAGLGAEKFPCPMAADLDRNAYSGLKGADYVIISADALTTRAFPALLDIIGESGSVAVEGVSAPASALLFAFDMPVGMVNGVLGMAEFDPDGDGSPAERGAGRFCVEPQKPLHIHETDAARKITGSPYGTGKFNPNAFRRH